MPFRDHQTCLEDIFGSIKTIRKFVEGMDGKDYRQDLKTRSAVERQLQILTKAGFRLGKDAQQLCPEIDWPNLRGMGNRLRHAYDLTDPDKVWRVIQHDLPPLDTPVAKALEILASALEDIP